MNEFVTLAGALGIGSITTLVVQRLFLNWDKKHEAQLREKREAYIGLLDAYRNAAIESSHEARMNFAYWRLRCELVAPTSVQELIGTFSESEPFSDEQASLQRQMIDAFRNDLEIPN